MPYDFDIDKLLRGVDLSAITAGMGEMPAPGGNVYNPGLLGKMFGGSNVPGGLIPDDLLKKLHNRSLLAAGLGLMEASHTRGRNNLGAGLSHALATGQETFQSGLEGAEKQATLGRQVGETDRITELRKEIAAKYPSVKDETPAQKVQRLTNMAAEYAQGGDHQTATNLVQTANALRLSASSGKPFRYMQQNGRIIRIDNATGETKTIVDDGSLEARQEIAQANLELRRENTGLSKERLELAKQAAARPGEGERKTALLLGLAKTVQPVLDAAPAPSRKAWAATRMGINEGLDTSEQKFYVSANQFMDSYVRETSGAALNQGELARAWMIYIPEPGDSRAALAYKKELRQALIDGLIVKGGRASKAFIMNPAGPNDVDDVPAGSGSDVGKLDEF